MSARPPYATLADLDTRYLRELPHPFASKEAAAMAAAAEARKWAASAGTGMFTSHGLPEAVAGAPTACTGYGTPIDDTDWLSTVVTHDVIPQVGWDTTVETEVKPP